MVNLRLALRTLFKTPFVTIMAILSIALGIGVNVGIFSIFEQLLLRPLPVQEPSQLVNLATPGPIPGNASCNQAGTCDEVFSYPMYRDLVRVQSVFTAIAAHRLFHANLAARGVTVNADGMLVSGSYFPVLGIRPALGRLFGPEDDRVIGEPHAVVLSYVYWQTRFGQDPGVLDQTLIVNGQAMTIVGVAPRGFAGTTITANPYVFVPITMRGLLVPGFDGFNNRQSYWAYLFARLKPGLTQDQACVALNVPYQRIIKEVEAPIQKGLSEQTMKWFMAKRLVLNQGAHGQSRVVAGGAGIKTGIVMLFAVSGFVLIIACANVANLLLARGAARAGEMAVRLSLGASRLQVVGQLLTESCILTLLAGCAGILVAEWTLDLIASLVPARAVTFFPFSLDRATLLFAAALALGTGLLFGIFPAMHSTKCDLVSAFRNQAGRASGAKSAARFRTALATAQITLSLALLIIAGLLTKSLYNVARIDLGLKAETVTMFGISPELNGYSPRDSALLFERLEDELTAFPGVTSVGDASVPLLGGSSWGGNVLVEGYETGPDTDMDARYNEIGPGYFQTLGIPLISGREFTRSDSAYAPKVAIVNEAFARKFNLERNAVGKYMADTRPGMYRPSKTGRGMALDIEIVGLVQNAGYSDVKSPAPPVFFLPYRQNDQAGRLTFYVRTALDPGKFLPGIQKLLARLDPNLPAEDLRTVPQQVRENFFVDRMLSALSAGFACLATLLAAVGLYGVIAYMVVQRTREIGLRIALGASPAQVRTMVLRQVGLITLVGGAVGLALAMEAGRLIESLLFETKGSDPAVFCGSAVALVIVALAAGFIPALQAARLEPMQVLRHE